MATLSSICSNDAGWKWACACWPLVLIWQATDVYIISCFSVVLWRLWTMICYPFLICCGTWQYSDKDFTGQGAIGAVDGEIVDAEWVRADELASRGKDGKPQKMKLYEGKVEPRDLVQGAVGDCWMVAALACSAEHPPCIRNAFLTREYNPRGSYRVRMYALGRIELGFRFRFRAGSGPSEHGPRACTDLWTPIGSRVRSFDGQTGSWVVITVDDHVPCRRGTRQPIYCKLHGNELWAVLLEKAFAKFCGSYKALDGGWYPRWIDEPTPQDLCCTHQVLRPDRGEVCHSFRVCSEHGSTKSKEPKGRSKNPGMHKVTSKAKGNARNQWPTR